MTLTAERVRQVLDYDPETGIFRWRQARGSKPAGSEAGCLDLDGYRLIRVDGTLYRACRLAWLYSHGVWPDDDVDHRNRDRSNDRLDNLRPATRSQNLFNQPARGCHFYARKQKWHAQIRVNGRRIHLGYFGTEAEGREAYAKAAEKHHGEFARTVT